MMHVVSIAVVIETLCVWVCERERERERERLVSVWKREVFR